MNYQELRDYALQCSLEHHLCNVEQLLDDGETIATIMNLVETSRSTIDIYLPYEHYGTESLCESIEDMRGVKVWEYMHVLRQVNGDEWSANFKGAN